VTGPLILAGFGQLGLALGSLALPRILSWREDTARLRPLTREVFWTYAAYIWITNLCFGVLSVAAPEWLLDGTPLSRALSAYIAVYWGTRLVLQLFVLDRSSAPPGLVFRAAHWVLVALFASFSGTYALLAW
jgi:hypothetical protein